MVGIPENFYQTTRCHVPEDDNPYIHRLQRFNLTKNFVTHLLTAWSRVLFEKLTGSQLDKKFHAFYGTRRFITAFTRTRHLPLS
jgi:hypothetical protein